MTKITKAFRAGVKALTPESKVSPCCAEPIAWECLMGGGRLFRTVKGRKVYDAKCPKCNVGFTVFGGPAQ